VFGRRRTPFRSRRDRVAPITLDVAQPGAAGDGGNSGHQPPTPPPVLGSIADGVVVVDRDLKVRWANQAAEEILETSWDGISGKECREVFDCRRDGDLSCGAVCPFRRVVATGESLIQTAFPAKRKDVTIWISGSLSPLDGDGTNGVVATLRDVTTSREVEDLESDFVSIVSHELRGPLTALKGFVQTLIRKGDELPDETKKDFLETINQQADRLNQLVEDLLNVSRIEARRLQMKIVPVDLEERVKRLVDEFQTKWGHHDIVTDRAPDLPKVPADEKKIDEILINLLDNAVKYSPGGGRVTVLLQQVDDDVQVSVEDSGIGIAPEDAARLFQKFHRIATPQTREIGGTGLGLYIVKHLVEAQGGRIWVTSAPGRGSTFTFTLPLDGPPGSG
jgi:two-component system phosphate regulon sensor histidine kinase PhoR